MLLKLIHSSYYMLCTTSDFQSIQLADEKLWISLVTTRRDKFMKGTVGLVIALRPIFSSHLIFKPQVRTWTVLPSLRTPAMDSQHSIAAVQCTSAALTGKFATNFEEGHSNIISSSSNGCLNDCLQQSDPKTPNSGIAKRKVAVHVAYCGTGFQGGMRLFNC